MNKLIAFLSFLCLSPSSAFAQNWTNYSHSNSGLSDNVVTSISVDNNHVAWIGASNGCSFVHGLNRFDGTNWTNFNHNNSGLASDAVRRVLTDQNNIVWITYQCAGLGLTKFDGTNWFTYDTTNSNIPSDLIGDLFLDPNNELWLACNGITKFNGTSFINYYSGLPFSDTFVTLLVDGSTVYAVGQYLGLYKFDTITSNVVIYDQSNSNIPSMCFGTLNKDQNGILWMGSNYDFTNSTGGLATFDGNSFTAINPFIYSNTWVYFCQCIAIDQSNNVWVATRCEGLYKFNGNTWTHIVQNLPQNGCAGFVYNDPDNRIWYGEVSSGLWTNTPFVGIVEQPAKDPFLVFPNPSTGILNVSGSLSDLKKISVKNMLGQEIYSSAENNFTGNLFTIDLSAFSKGIYFVQLQGTNTEMVKKIVLSK